MTGRSAEVSIPQLPGRPLRVDVDPEFDLFRRLDRTETPPALSQAFGAEQGPRPAPVGRTVRTRGSLSHPRRTPSSAPGPGEVETREDRRDRRVAARPRGLPPRLGEPLPARRPRRDRGVRRGARRRATCASRGATLPRDGHAFVLTARHPAQPGADPLWAALDRPGRRGGPRPQAPALRQVQLPRLRGRRTGQRRQGALAGDRLAADAPASSRTARPPRRRRRWRNSRSARPLATLPPALFPRADARGRARARRPRARRAAASARRGLDAAAELIAAAFAQAGLQPAGDAPGSWFQAFAARGGDPRREAVAEERRRGHPRERAATSSESLLVIGAHYDHLGDGDPGCLPANRGTRPPRRRRQRQRRRRPARAGAHALEGRPPCAHGRLRRLRRRGGGAARVAALRRRAAAFAPARTLAMVDLDTVGRLDGRKVLVLGGALGARVGAHLPRRRLPRGRGDGDGGRRTSTRATT